MCSLHSMHQKSLDLCNYLIQDVVICFIDGVGQIYNQLNVLAVCEGKLMRTHRDI